MRKELNPVGVFLLITRWFSLSVVRTCSNSSIFIFDTKDLLRQSNMDSLSARFFLFLIIRFYSFFFLFVFITLNTAGLNKMIASFSFSLQLSIVLALPSVESILTTKQLNDKLINLMKLTLTTDFVFNSVSAKYQWNKTRYEGF